MTDDPCPGCGSTAEPTAEDATAASHRVRDTAVLDAELPDDLQVALGRFLGSESVDTLGDWVGEVRRHIGGGSISIDELCLTTERTEHWGTVDGERHHFACFYDAVILAALSNRPADIRTESPNGDVIEARVVGSSDLTVTPDEAMFSFGIETNVDPPSAEWPTLERAYASICPYVRAFPNTEAYEQWAERVPAATVAMPLAGGTELAEALARGRSD
jgi:hypothetical protein